MSGNKQSLIDSYNEKATERNSGPVQDWKVQERHVFLSYLIKENAKCLLEIGAGPGRDSLFFKEQGLETFSTFNLKRSTCVRKRDFLPK